MKDGRNKGNRFENTVCRKLSKWYGYPSQRLADLPFRRRSTSIMPVEGHWRGEGDVLYRPDVAFPFAVECKKHEGWELDGSLYVPTWPIWEWWDQAQEQAGNARLCPLLVFSRNHRPIYVLLKEREATWLKLRPKHGPVVVLWRRSGELLVLALLDDLVETEKRLAERLARRSWGTGHVVSVPRAVVGGVKVK